MKIVARNRTYANTTKHGEKIDIVGEIHVSLQ